MAKRLMLAAALILGSVTFVAGSGALAPAEARIVVGVGIGPWGGYYPGYYGDPYYYGYAPGPYYGYGYPPPAGYAPGYAPGPTTYAPAPAPATQAPAPQQAANWYYCDNPQGYYPYVPNCSVAWRQVAAQPQQ